jgi:hypothetical protein
VKELLSKKPDRGHSTNRSEETERQQLDVAKCAQELDESPKNFVSSSQRSEMKDDFRTITPEDFESLCEDLLRAKEFTI